MKMRSFDGSHLSQNPWRRLWEAKLTGITAARAAFLQHIKLLYAMPRLEMIT